MYVLGCMYSLLWRLIFDKSIAAKLAHLPDTAIKDGIPFRFPLCVDGHVESIFFDLSGRIEFLGEKTNKLGFI